MLTPSIIAGLPGSIRAALQEPFLPELIYGLDIETDNSAGYGLVPARSRVTEAAVAVEGGGVVFNDADEVSLLTKLHQYLETLRPGLIVTWNGSPFDMPFLSDRADILGLPFGPAITPDGGLEPKYEPLPGHAGGYAATWPVGTGLAHQHLDVAYVYKQEAADLGVKWSLKPFCTAVGIEMVELDRENLHRYTQAERDAYNLSDAVGTRRLALRAFGYDA